jgi:hypothetical protein
VRTCETKEGKERKKERRGERKRGEREGERRGITSVMEKEKQVPQQTTTPCSSSWPSEIKSIKQSNCV